MKDKELRTVQKCLFLVFIDHQSYYCNHGLHFSDSSSLRNRALNLFIVDFSSSSVWVLHLRRITKSHRKSEKSKALPLPPELSLYFNDLSPIAPILKRTQSHFSPSRYNPIFVIIRKSGFSISVIWGNIFCQQSIKFHKFVMRSNEIFRFLICSKVSA